MKISVLKSLSLPGADILSEGEASREQKLAIFFIGVYIIASLVYGLMAGAPWDDDCVTRYYNTKKAIADPSMFFSLWNRPLFVLLFFPVAQIGPTAMMLQMIAITTIAGYYLFKAVEGMQVRYSSLVLPLFFFQTYFFSVSRNNLTEPLAVAIICLGLYFLVRERYLWFAVVGSLLPLARLELSVLLAVWGLVLIMRGQWKYLWILAVPTLVVDLIGIIYKDGDVMWMVNETFGKESEENRYGHTDFWSYFKRYIFVTGPVVFYFMLIGLFERVSRWKIDLFIFVQFVLGFMLYVVFSWKLNMGNAAGFLRNLIPLTPMVAVIALFGFNYWVNAFKPLVMKRDEVPDEEVINEAAIEEVSGQKHRSKGKRQRMNEERIKKKREERRKAAYKKEGRKHLFRSVRVHLISLGVIALTYFYYSTSIKMHHKLTGDTDYTNPIIIASLGGLLLLFVLVRKLLANKGWLVYILSGILLVTTSAYTLITEPPDSHYSPERKVLTEVAELYTDSYLRNDKPLYVNHLWFFWSSGLDYPSEEFKALNKENLEKAPDSSIVIWETHYSDRIFGDVDLPYMENNVEFVELCRIISPDNKFTVAIFQKVDSAANKVQYADRFISEYPDYPYGYFSRAKLYYLEQQYDKSMADVNKVFALDSTFIHAYFSKGLVYHAMGDFDKASESFKKIADALPKYYQANYNAGISLAAAGKQKEAISYLERVVKEKKDYWEGYQQLGALHFNTGDYAKAIGYFNVVATGQPNNAQNYLNRANCLFRQERFEDAIKDYDRCLRLNPKYPLAYFNKGLALGQLQKKTEACDAMLQAAKLGYSQATAVYNTNCR